MENKKSNVGWVIITIVLLLIIGGLSFIVLKDKGIIKIGKDSNKTETKVEDKTKKESKKEEVNKTENETKYRLYSGELTIEDKDFGKVEFGGKEVSMKYSFDTENLKSKVYVDNKVIEISNQGLNNIAIMGDYIVIGYELRGGSYKFELYNSKLEKVEEVGNSFGAILGIKADTSKWIIDENNLIYYQCTSDYTTSDNDKLETYNLKITDSKIEKVLLSSNQGVACSPQR